MQQKHLSEFVTQSGGFYFIASLFLTEREVYEVVNPFPYCILST